MLYPYEHQWYRDTNNPGAFIAPDKGHYGGSCNRTDCQAPASAHWWNQSTLKFYCITCASLINEGVTARELERLGYDTTGLCVCEYSALHPFTCGSTPNTRDERYIQLEYDILKQPKRYTAFKHLVDTGNRSGLIACLSQEFITDIHEWGSAKTEVIESYVCKIIRRAYIDTFVGIGVLEDNHDVNSILNYLLYSPHGIYIPSQMYLLLRLTHIALQDPEKAFCWGQVSRHAFERDGGSSAFLNCVQQVRRSLFKKESVQRAATRSLLALYNSYFKNVSAAGF